MIRKSCICPAVDEIVKIALIEDIGSGDITTSYLVDPLLRGHSKVMAGEMLVVAGITPFVKAFQFLSSEIEFVFLENEGTVIQKGEAIAELKGPYNTLLSGERTALNFLQRLSGIATLTHCFLQKIKKYKSVLLDTRKTTPGWRVMEKEAVRLGGGTNHRMGLFDAVLIKENHIAACAGSVRAAVEKAKRTRSPLVNVEVEVRGIEELREVIDLKPDMVMLDNMTIEEIRQAVKIVSGRVPLEVSGNITIESIEEVASTGVEYISAGALTHSSRAVDISMITEPEK